MWSKQYGEETISGAANANWRRDTNRPQRRKSALRSQLRAKQAKFVSEVEKKAGTTEDEDGKLVASNVSRERASMQACVPIAHAVRCLIASDNQAASSTAA